MKPVHLSPGREDAAAPIYGEILSVLSVLKVKKYVHLLITGSFEDEIFEIFGNSFNSVELFLKANLQLCQHIIFYQLERKVVI